MIKGSIDGIQQLCWQACVDNSSFEHNFFLFLCSEPHSVQHCSALKLIRNPWPSTIPASPAQPTSQTASSTSNHALVALSSFSDRKWVQRKCVVCSHVHHRQQEVCWFCAECGENAILCLSCTGHTCYQFHVIENGLPQWIQWASWHTYIDVWACALLYIVLNCSLLPNLHPFLFISYLMTIT